MSNLPRKFKFDQRFKDILFQPLVEFMGESDLIIYESTETLKQGKSQFINVAIYNPSPHEKFLKQGTEVGHVIDITAVIYFPV